jgi:hypothetical protein
MATSNPSSDRGVVRGSPSYPGSLWRHKHRQRHLDELFILVNRFQGATHISTDLGWSALLDPKRKLQDGSLKGELVSLILNSREGSRSEFGIVNPPWSFQRSSRISRMEIGGVGRMREGGENGIVL